MQLAYAIGVAEPVSVFVDSYGTAKVSPSGSDRSVEATDAYIAGKVREIFNLRPAAIVRRFGLKKPIFEPTAAYGHMGRKPYVKDGIQYFGWEKLNAVDDIRRAFGL